MAKHRLNRNVKERICRACSDQCDAYLSNGNPSFNPTRASKHVSYTDDPRGSAETCRNYLRRER